MRITNSVGSTNPSWKTLKSNSTQAPSVMTPHPRASLNNVNSRAPERYSTGLSGDTNRLIRFRDHEASARNEIDTPRLARNRMSHSRTPPSRKPTGSGSVDWFCSMNSVSRPQIIRSSSGQRSRSNTIGGECNAT